MTGLGWDPPGVPSSECTEEKNHRAEGVGRVNGGLEKKSGFIVDTIKHLPTVLSKPIFKNVEQNVVKRTLPGTLNLPTVASYGSQRKKNFAPLIKSIKSGINTGARVTSNGLNMVENAIPNKAKMVLEFAGHLAENQIF